MSRHREPIHPSLIISKHPNKFGGHLAKKITATKEVREWLNQSTLDHWYFVTLGTELFVEFCNPKDALLFKMSWTGRP